MSADKFQQDAEETPVIFRKWKDGDVIALFPAQLGDTSPYTCGSYAHVGQHGAADPYHVMSQTEPATADDYADLKRELETDPYGYRLKVCKRLRSLFLEQRKAQLEAMNAKV